MTTDVTRQQKLDRQLALDRKHEALAWLIRGNTCRTCDSKPRVAWIQGDWVMRCNCYPRPPVLVNEIREILRRREASCPSKD